MSWDDVIIGTGNKGTSAIKVFDCPGLENVSENRVSYWVHDTYLGIGMTIFKNTKEGESLEFMLKNGDSANTISRFLEELALKRIDQKRLRAKISAALATAYREGAEAKQAEIRNALGLAR